jgi:hypothetical protein
MDGFKEKKWFVYMGDHHEGPFSLEEIQGKMQAGIVTSSQYVWCEGMNDWQQIPEVEAVQALLRQPPLRLVPTPAPTPTPTEHREPTLTDATRMAPISAGEGTIAVSRSDITAPDSNVAVAEAPPIPAIVEAPLSASLQATLQSEPAPAPSAHADVVTIAPHQASPQMEASPEEVPPSAGSRRKSKWIRPVLWGTLFAALIAAIISGVFDPFLRNPAITAMMHSMGDLSRPVLLKVSAHVPMISGWFSPIPHLDEISAEEWPDFMDAARTPTQGQAPRVGLAVVQPDLLQPSFALATSMADGAAFDLEIEGVADTLLNHTDFKAKASIAVANRLGRSNPIRTIDGRPVPRGEYIVKVYEAGKSGDGATPLLKKAYFLGGVKDDTYRERLKEYHDRLTQKAKAELEELKQFLSSVEQQLQSSQAEFAKFRGAKGKKSVALASKAWAGFHQRWAQFDAQLSTAVQSWTPEKLQSDTFYPMLYERVRSAAQAGSQVHGLHHSWTTGAASPQSFETDLQNAVVAVNTSIAEAKAKIQQAETIPPSPTGMPRKDGL